MWLAVCDGGDAGGRKKKVESDEVGCTAHGEEVDEVGWSSSGCMTWLLLKTLWKTRSEYTCRCGSGGRSVSVDNVVGVSVVVVVDVDEENVGMIRSRRCWSRRRW